MQCSNNNDILKTPIGLITADELMFGGIAYSGNATGNYLVTGQDYWTMSPAYFISGTTAHVYRMYFSGGILNDWVNNVYGVRPVINLKADTKFVGSGTSTDPFTVG